MTGYHEKRAVLRDAEAMVEIEVRGGVEADDGSEALDVTVRDVPIGNGERRERTMRVSISEWHAFTKAVRAAR